MGQRAVVNWWALAIRGLASVAFGIACLGWAGRGHPPVVPLLAAYLLVNGFFAVIGGTSRRSRAMILEGTVTLATAGIVLSRTRMDLSNLVLVLAAWAVLTGLIQARSGLVLHRQIAHEWPLVLSGVTSVVFGVALVAYRRVDLHNLVSLMGEYSVVWGELLVIASAGLWTRRRTFLSTGPRVAAPAEQIKFRR